MSRQNFIILNMWTTVKKKQKKPKKGLNLGTSNSKYSEVPGLAVTLAKKPDVVHHIKNGWTFCGVWSSKDQAAGRIWGVSPRFEDYKLFRIYENYDLEGNNCGDLLILKKEHNKSASELNYDEIVDFIISSQMDELKKKKWHFCAIWTKKDQNDGRPYQKSEEFCEYSSIFMPKSHNFIILARRKR